MADIQINGLEELVRKFNGLEKVTELLRPPMQRAVLRVQAKMAKYPPQRPGSRYVRGRGWADKNGKVKRLTSENLGKKWTTKVDRVAGGITGKVGNNVSYGPFVQSKQFQAKVHQGRWTNTDEVVLAQELPAITADFNATVQAELDK